MATTSPIDLVFGMRLDFMVSWCAFGLLSVDVVRDSMVLRAENNNDSENALREASEYYARNASSTYLGSLMPCIAVLALVSMMTRVWYRRGREDWMILVLGTMIGIAGKCWVVPHERALVSCPWWDRSGHLASLGRVHIGQLTGFFLMLGLHWRSLYCDRCAGLGVLDRSAATSALASVEGGTVGRSNRSLVQCLCQIVVRHDVVRSALTCTHGFLRAFSNIIIDFGKQSWESRARVRDVSPKRWSVMQTIGAGLLMVLLVALGHAIGGVFVVLIVVLPNLLLYAACGPWVAAAICPVYALTLWPAEADGSSVASSAAAASVLAASYSAWYLGVRQHELLLVGALINPMLLAAEVARGGSNAAPTWVSRLLVGANSAAMLAWALWVGLCHPQAHMVMYGVDFKDLRLARWCVWHRWCLGLAGLASACLSPACLPLSALLLGCEKMGACMFVFGCQDVASISGAFRVGSAHKDATTGTSQPSNFKADASVGEDSRPLASTHDMFSVHLIYDVASGLAMLTYGTWLVVFA